MVDLISTCNTFLITGVTLLSFVPLFILVVLAIRGGRSAISFKFVLAIVFLIAASSISVLIITKLSCTSSSLGGQAPSAPLNLLATPQSGGKIFLIWLAPNNGGTSPITGYHIDRAVGLGGTFIVRVSNTNSVITTYNDTGLNAGTLYTYRVSAINAFGTGPVSNNATGTALP